MGKGEKLVFDACINKITFAVEIVCRSFKEEVGTS